ncbi:MAG: hypothetical protein B7Y40_04330 [Gammaproteobacteria bacterium 28-57-27]|nr:MAG: hypothetical protein B7Y40_04330 [Gammaproteobacteria bacterium 28-57-27]
MTNFIAIKIHYDHRKSIPPHLKYSKPPSAKEYDAYLKIYREEDVGGNGFHECLNYSIPENGNVQMYLPPTCIPGRNRIDEEFVIFSFTYKTDREMPSCIVGVHAGAAVLKKPKKRKEIETIDGIKEPLIYRVEAPQNLVTLFTPPIDYDFHDGTYTPRLKTWGNGLRNIEEIHAKNIIAEALRSATKEISSAKLSKRVVLERQIDVLNEINSRYFSAASLNTSKPPKTNTTGGISPPDQELGFLGEKYVYEHEVAHAEKIGALASDVEWISQSVPQSPFDIKSVRKIDGKFIDHYIEVKSSRAEDESNIYVSSGQIEFFKNNEDCSSFVFASFDRCGSLKNIRYLSLSVLLNEFDLSPIKFKLQKRYVDA